MGSPIGRAMRSPLLVDTCTGIWIVEGTLSKATTDIITDQAAEGQPIYVSPITAWELGLLLSCGKYRAPLEALEFFARLTGQPGFAIAEMPPEVLVAASYLPQAKLRDPADRIIAATARTFGYTLLTGDRDLLRYAHDGYLSAYPARRAG